MAFFRVISALHCSSSLSVQSVCVSGMKMLMVLAFVCIERSLSGERGRAVGVCFEVETLMQVLGILLLEGL